MTPTWRELGTNISQFGTKLRIRVRVGLELNCAIWVWGQVSLELKLRIRIWNCSSAFEYEINITHWHLELKLVIRVWTSNCVFEFGTKKFRNKIARNIWWSDLAYFWWGFWGDTQKMDVIGRRFTIFRSRYTNLELKSAIDTTWEKVLFWDGLHERYRPGKLDILAWAKMQHSSYYYTIKHFEHVSLLSTTVTNQS